MPGVEGESRGDVREVTGCRVVCVLTAPCSDLYYSPGAGQEGPLLWAPGFRVPCSGFPLPVPHPTSKESGALAGMLLPSMRCPLRVHMASDAPAQGTPIP